jgi:hypothetical protein
MFASISRCRQVAFDGYFKNNIKVSVKGQKQTD